MTCGIYILYFETDDFQYYVGKSINIEARYKEHCSKLSNKKHKNNDLVNGYNVYGLPSINILEEMPASTHEMYIREIFWIDLFNCYHDGMNETVGGAGTGYGENSPRSNHTNEQIIEVFNYLVDTPELSLKRVSIITEVPYIIVKSIAEGAKHSWLASKFPKRYDLMLSMIGTRSRGASAKDRGIIYPPIVSPEGTCYTVDNASNFAKEYGLHKGSLYNVLNGKAKYHRGWKLYKENES